QMCRGQAVFGTHLQTEKYIHGWNLTSGEGRDE
ncbi:MAG: hypothetical protein ACI9RO_002125, partial [Alteromonas macleodii]